MTCRFCNQSIYWVPQHTGPDILVHAATGDHHCNADWEVRGGHVATAKQEKEN